MLSADDPLPPQLRRITVAGVSGSGKTTLCTRIAAAVAAPHTEVDSLYHGPGWTVRDNFAADVAAIIEGDSWVLEWQASGARALINERADLFVWLDYPFWAVTFPRVIRRTVRRRLRGQELWNGNVEPPLYTVLTRPHSNIIRWSISTRHLYRSRIATLAAAKPDLPIVRLAHPRHADRLLARLRAPNA